MMIIMKFTLGDTSWRRLVGSKSGKDSHSKRVDRIRYSPLSSSSNTFIQNGSLIVISLLFYAIYTPAGKFKCLVSGHWSLMNLVY